MDISTLIPQLFYDVIGRIIPGTTLLASAFILFFEPKDGLTYLATWNGASVSTVLIVMGNLVAAYVVASLLGGIWFRVYRIECLLLLDDLEYPLTGWAKRGENRIEIRLGKIKKELEKKPGEEKAIASTDSSARGSEEKPEKKSVEESPSREYVHMMDTVTDQIAFMYDYVMLRCPKAGARIAKLRAEQHMSGVLMIGFAALALYCIALVCTRGIVYLLPFLFLILAAFCAGSLVWHLEKRCGAALINLWLIASSGEPEK